MDRNSVNISLVGCFLFLLWTFCVISVASEANSSSKTSSDSSQTRNQNTSQRQSLAMERSLVAPPPRKLKLTRRRMTRPKVSERYSTPVYENYGHLEEEEAFDEYDVQEYARNKRFYPIEPGCIKGYLCCQLPYCRPYCSLCKDQSFYGDQDCVDRNMNTICDDEEEDERMLAEEQERKKKEDEEREKMLAEEQERKKKEDEEKEKEKMLAEEQERKKKEEEDKEKMLAEEQERKKMEEEKAAEEAERQKRKNTTKMDKGQLEFTHHIYEEYQPILPKEAKPPIILQTIPQYSISNFYSLSRHQHHQPPFDRPQQPTAPRPPPSIHPHGHHHNQHLHHYGLSGYEADANPNGHYLGFQGSHHQSHSHRDPTLFYGDLQSLTGPRGSTGSRDPLAPPRMTHIANGRHHQRHHRYPTHLFDQPDEAPPLYVSSSAGSKPLPNPYISNPLHSHGGYPKPQTIIYEDKPDYSPPPPPQPLLKYHLIRQSYPAAAGGENKEYFAEIPAFMPGPPYPPKALPSRRHPLVKRPHQKNNRKGKLMTLKGKKKTKSQRNRGLGSLVRNLLG